LLPGQALYERQLSVDEVHAISKIDTWFLRRLERIADHSRALKTAASLEALGKEVCVLNTTLYTTLCIPNTTPNIELHVLAVDHCVL
jgi:hypothetical protein